MEHLREAFRAVILGRQCERLSRRLDLGLGPADPLGHRRLGDQERGRDLAGGQAADRAQRQRDGQRRAERGVAAHEHEDQRVVAPRRRVRAGHRPRGGDLLPAAAGILAAVGVGQAARGHPDQPAERIVRLAVTRPGARGCDECLLRRVLGIGKVAVPADERAEDLRRQLAQQVLDRVRRGHSSGSGALSTSRTSIRCLIGTPSWPGEAEARAAISMARCADSTSTSR